MEVPFSTWKMEQDMSKLEIVRVQQSTVMISGPLCQFVEIQNQMALENQKQMLMKIKNFLTLEYQKKMILRYVTYNQHYNQHIFAIQPEFYQIQHYNYSYYEGPPIFLQEGQRVLSSCHNRKAGLQEE